MSLLATLREPRVGLRPSERAVVRNERDIAARLDEFKKLKMGWLDGKGIAPERSHLDWLADAFRRNYADDLPLPYLYPTAEGGVQAEWTVGGWESSLDINLCAQSGEWHALALTSGDEEARTLQLNDIRDWRWLATTLTRQNSDAGVNR